MEAKTITAKRPLAITVVCLIGLLWLLLSLPAIINGRDFLDYTYTGFTAVVTLGCLIGFWKMKKVALYIYFSAFVVNQFMDAFLEHWNFNSMIIPLLIIGTTMFYHNKMN